MGGEEPSTGDALSVEPSQGEEPVVVDAVVDGVEDAAAVGGPGGRDDDPAAGSAALGGVEELLTDIAQGNESEEPAGGGAPHEGVEELTASSAQGNGSEELVIADPPDEVAKEEARCQTFEGLWEDEDGNVVRAEGTTLCGPDGKLDITPVDDRSFLFTPGLETFKATVGDDGRLVWDDGSSWSRKEMPSNANSEPAPQDTATKEEDKPPELRMGTKARWAFITKDLHLFLASASLASGTSAPSGALAEVPRAPTPMEAQPSDAASPDAAPTAELPSEEPPSAPTLGEAQAVEAQPLQAQSAEAQQAEMSLAEDPPTDEQPPEAQLPEAQPPPAQLPEAQPPEAQPPEAQPPQAQPLEGQSLEVQLPEVQPPDARSPEAQPPEAQPPEAQLPEAQPPEAQPPEAQPLEAQPPEAEPPVARGAPPLDAQPERLAAILEPMRQKLRGSIGEKLTKYDSSYRYPRPEDTKTATRDGLEEQLRVDGLKELRTAIRKEYNYGAVGQVWKVVGGEKSGGIIARVDDEVRSDKTDTRLSCGALVEELTTKEERLKYRLISGSGPETAWVTTRVKAGFTGFRDLAVKVPPEARPVSIAVLGLMAAHIRTQARLDRFCHVLRSVQRQRLNPEHAQFLFAVSWSSTPELRHRVQSAIEEFTLGKESSEGGGTGTLMFAVHQVERHSQFQHLKAALTLAEERLRERWSTDPEDGCQRSAWVLFGDDDDIWHSCRVAEYVGAIRAHTMLDSVGVFVTTTRVNCTDKKRLTDEDMPINEEQVDTFLKSGKGVRMDKKEECQQWRSQLRTNGPLGNCQPTPVNCGLEYFDLCPRLRLVHEFFSQTSSDFLTHRYCDLTFNEFLTAYPLQGREMGLELSVFFAGCWMLFYATPIPDEKAWKGSVETGVDANNGHMSSVYSIEPIEKELARRSIEDFKEHEAITEDQLARYWAAYRAQLECYLVRKRGYKIDQRIFDCIVFLAMNGSFFSYWDAVRRRSKFRQEAAYDMMCYISQGFAKAIAAELLVDVLWLRPHLFLEPEMDGQAKDQPHFGYGYGPGWFQPGGAYGYGKGPFGKHPAFTGPWGFGKGVGKGPGVIGNPLGLNKPFGKGHAGKGGGKGMHAPVLFSPYANSKTSHFHKKL